MKALLGLFVLMLMASAMYIALHSSEPSSPEDAPHPAWNMYQDIQDQSDWERNPWKYGRDKE